MTVSDDRVRELIAWLESPGRLWRDEKLEGWSVTARDVASELLAARAVVRAAKPLVAGTWDALAATVYRPPLAKAFAEWRALGGAQQGDTATGGERGA